VSSALLAGALWLIRAALKWWIDGPEAEPSTAPWPELADPRAGDLDKAGDDLAGVGAGVGASANGRVAAGAPGPPSRAGELTGAVATDAPEPGATRNGAGAHDPASNGAGADTQAERRGSADRTWVHLDEAGAALASHPVKAKESSRLYHLPGMLAYERTRPDRCYQSAEAAEADGFVRAKR
jgi:hypothetical protein